MAYVRENRRGEKELRKMAKTAKNKDGEEVNAGICYFEVGSKLFKLNICECNKEGGKYWVTITEKKKRSQQSQSGKF